MKNPPAPTANPAVHVAVKMRPAVRSVRTQTPDKRWTIGPQYLIEARCGKRWMPLADEDGKPFGFDSAAERDTRLAELRAEAAVAPAGTVAVPA